MAKKSSTQAANPQPVVPNKQFLEAADFVRMELCKDFFRVKELSPDRVFCNYSDPLTEAVLQYYQFEKSDSGDNMTWHEGNVDMSLIRVDQALNEQDRRDLDKLLIRPQTMLSFMANGDEIDSGAVVLRCLPDGTYLPGDGRHRLVWAAALGCKTANAYLVHCKKDELWNDLREEFNNRMGAQRTEEERMYLVYRKLQIGGQGSMRELCRRFGISESKYITFRDQQIARKKAADNGLIANNAPIAVITAAVKAVEEKNIDKEVAQKLIDAATSAVPTQSKNVTAVLEDLDSGEYTPETISKAASDIRQEVGRSKITNGRTRGPNRSNRTKFMQGIDMATKAAEKGKASDIGMDQLSIKNYHKKVEILLNYLKIAIIPEVDDEAA